MPKTIMTADDSASIRLMVNFALRDLGYDIIMAENGKDALRKMEVRKIDLLISDVNMPELDGISLVKRVRENPAYKFIPIIMLTTESLANKKHEGMRAGASGWLVKPFKPEELIAVVRKMLG